MEIRAGPAACNGQADEPSPAGNAVALRRPEESISCAPTPSSPPDNPPFRVATTLRPSGLTSGYNGCTECGHSRRLGFQRWDAIGPPEHGRARQNDDRAEIEGRRTHRRADAPRTPKKASAVRLPTRWRSTR